MNEKAEKKRCAVYTRKSVEEGLEMEFNSLDAQREAGENYIASQKMNGWVCIPERYDDGGWSGGNMERPALKRLMSDIEAGKIDMVVIYKLDRLSRSLIDFADLQTFFDRHSVSFCAVTQEINTSTSSGRMMLNILISFAQYEREIIAERIRDKIAASKKHGKFCGGVPMLGYKPDPDTKKLQIVPEEAKTVKAIYEKYMLFRSLRCVVSELNRLGSHTKEWTSARGRAHKARPWDTGSVYRILSSPIYAGYVSHYDEHYEGEHKAIIDRAVWKSVQEMMRGNRGNTNGKKRTSLGNPFSGLIKCGCCGAVMTSTYSCRHGRKYFYYFCQRRSRNPEHVCGMKRIPAGDIEQAVMKQLAGLFRTPSILRATLDAVREREDALRESLSHDREILDAKLGELKKAALEGNADLAGLKETGSRLAEVKRQLDVLVRSSTEEEIIAALGDASGLWEFLIPAARYELLQLVIGSIVVSPDKIKLVLRVEGLKQLAEEMAVGGYFSESHDVSEEELPEMEQRVLDDGGIELTMPLKLKSIGGHRNVIVPEGNGMTLRQDAVIRAIHNARKWTDMVVTGQAANLSDLAKKLGLAAPYVTRILGLANLAPDIVEAVCNGCEPEGVSLARLVKGFPDDWVEQRMVMGFQSQ